MRYEIPGGFGSSLPSVVVLGGGHGMAANLTALRRVTDRLTAVVTVADDGGSSGRLREELACLPPGDLRMALAALCGDDAAGRRWAEVLQYRFESPGALDGHPIGNLMIAGLWQLVQDPVAGLDMITDLIGSRGRVLPMADQPLEIEAEVVGHDLTRPEDLVAVRGQVAVASTPGWIQSIRLLPDRPRACPEAVTAVLDADWVILGPGSWFTSVLPHLMVPELAEALTRTKARRILTLNITASEDETPDFTAARHIELVAEHEPRMRFDRVLTDSRYAAGDKALESYAASLGAELVVNDLIMRDGTARHNPLLLASAYAEILAESPGTSPL
ncbi:gluconeogenesis factor YvcK family protein [Propionibacteriaceae bacterium Y2011]|uniref:gluconeogenesis factor YvcK family protein n=1 Tax=Microlunatus sp. Y2014 TaxID=3418488 RepID=UPI003B4411FB